jgi:hypothetical protein
MKAKKYTFFISDNTELEDKDMTWIMDNVEVEEVVRLSKLKAISMKAKVYEASHLDIMNILFKMRERGDITDKQYNESEKRFTEIKK